MPAAELLRGFLADAIEQYGNTVMVMNFHSLHHLVDYCKRFGPLWTTWCFPFEKALGYAKRFVHGKKIVDDQFAFSWSTWSSLPRLEATYLRPFLPRAAEEASQLKLVRINR
jgi:hypothetical protein